jgi:pyruvate,water dikinase
VDILTELIGENDIDPVSLTRAFYYRTYFDMTTFGRIFEKLGLPAESLELMMGVQAGGQKMPMFKPNARMFVLLPRLLRFVYGKWRFSRYINRHLPEIEAEYKKKAAMRNNLQGTKDLQQQIVALKSLTRQAAYLNIIAPLLMSLYNGLLRKQLEKLGVDYEQLDLMAGMDSLHQYMPQFHLQRLNKQFRQLDPAVQERIQATSYTEFLELTGIPAFQENVALFIQQFGHLSDSGNDFSSVPWRENPDLILQMIVSYIQPGERADSRLKFDQIPLRGGQRWKVARIYEKARCYRLYREQISSMYTFGYGLFRDYYLALGDLLVRNGVLAEKEDIFYLYEAEVITILSRGASTMDYASLVAQRKREMEQYRHVELPDIIYGDQPPPVQVAARQVLYGTPTSRGYYTGPVKNVRGLQEFSKLENGDVLVIPYSDVGWTPLFARAGAVIAESGGILSHSSIIAREYNIPAVVSVAGALQLKDNTRVTIDGYKGEIQVHPESA